MCLIYFIAHNPRTKIDIPKGMYTIQKTKNKSYEKIRIKKWKNKKTPKHKKINKQATIQKLLNCTKRTEQEDQMRRQLDLVTAMFDWEKRLKKLAESYKVKIIYYQKIKRK